jgi:hypothetical protein
MTQMAKLNREMTENEVDGDERKQRLKELRQKLEKDRDDREAIYIKTGKDREKMRREMSR